MQATDFNNPTFNTSPTPLLKSNVSRREFLRRAALSSAGIAAQSALSKAAFAGDSKPRFASARAKRLSTANARGKNKQGVATPMPVVEAHIHLNQVGYLPNESKRAVIPAHGPIPGNSFSILDDDTMPKVRYQGELRRYTAPSGAQYGRFPHHYIAEFEDFTRPGRYRLRLSNGVHSAPFSIGPNLYRDLIGLTLDYFTIQRCGTGDNAPHNCHADDGVIVGGPRDGQILDGSGGWHDAGDYMKFVETASYVTALMLFTCDHFPQLTHSHSTFAPLPPLLANARVGLEWLLKMHPAPDEFYFQIGDESDHDVWRLPEQDSVVNTADWKPRLAYYGIGANLAGRTAAAFAIASRLYARHDQQFAHRCYEAAQTVYQLGLDNPVALSTIPADFYPEKTWEDDMAWGAIELHRATRKPEYLRQAIDFAHRAGAAYEATSIYNTHALAHYSLLPYVNGEDKLRLRQYLRADADYARLRSANPYGLATPYIWGTAEAAAGAALNCLLYAQILDDSSREVYLDVARQQRDFILGCNPFSMSYLIGAGTRYPLFPHHPIANLKKLELTGALVGGPATQEIFSAQHIVMDKFDDMQMLPGPIPPADLPDEVAVYHDTVQDYVTNEAAIDYTAKFLLLSAFYAHPA